MVRRGLANSESGGIRNRVRVQGRKLSGSRRSGRDRARDLWPGEYVPNFLYVESQGDAPRAACRRPEAPVRISSATKILSQRLKAGRSLRHRLFFKQQSPALAVHGRRASDRFETRALRRIHRAEVTLAGNEIVWRRGIGITTEMKRPLDKLGRVEVQLAIAHAEVANTTAGGDPHTPRGGYREYQHADRGRGAAYAEGCH